MIISKFPLFGRELFHHPSHVDVAIIIRLDRVLPSPLLHTLPEQMRNGEIRNSLIGQHALFPLIHFLLIDPDQIPMLPEFLLDILPRSSNEKKGGALERVSPRLTNVGPSRGSGSRCRGEDADDEGSDVLDAVVGGFEMNGVA